VSTWAVVVAAGSGERIADGDPTPKQYRRLGDRRVLDWSVGAARGACDGVVLVVLADRVTDVEPGVDVVVAGGVTRSGSVRAGLAAVPGAAEVIVVHDAARPVPLPEVWERVLGAVGDGADGAVPVVPVTDTLRARSGGTLDRTGVVAVQTPQAFRAGALRAAHAGEPEGTDDASLVEAAGGRVVVVDGDPANLKLTTAVDLAVAAAVLGDPAHPSVPVPVRVGHGVDVHPWSDDPDRPLVLGGVTFEGHAGLAGHSDADAVAHACTDALLGAAGLGDIGALFPDTDPRWAGADSVALLAEAAGRVRAEGWEPGNVDCTVVLDAPKIGPRRDELVAALTAAVGAPVSVKAKRTEGIGALGRGEGVVALAVAVLHRTARA
jgi:2-C-methyl-D-erythritol 4-phosphate cytidylyltransferase/2-C-methyl-D-erythritol 2,4-cyclodiphosphate synthase